MRMRRMTATLTLAAAGVIVGPAPAVSQDAEFPNPLTPLFVSGLTAWDDWVYFSADSDDVGTELWRSRDDQIELVADIDPGTYSPTIDAPADSYPAFLTPFDGWLYFRAETAATGSELWRTDGTTTELVADINAGADDSWPSELVVFDDHLYFRASGAGTTSALWRFDGEALETVAGTDRWVPGEFVILDGWLYFSGFGTAANGTYRTDGVTIEHVTELLAGYPAVLDGWIYFAGYEPDAGDELWRTDGSTTELVADIDPLASSGPYDLTVLGDWVYFAASTAPWDNELWRSNGTITELVADINPGPDWSRPEDLEVFGDWLYFRAETDATGAELWRTDGSGVELVADINPGSRSSEPESLEAVGGHLYFGANFAALWRTDGLTTERVGTPGAHVFSDYLHAGDPEVTGWTSAGFTPERTGAHTFVLEWAWGDDVRIDVRDASGTWVGAEVGADAPKLLTVDLEAGVGYRVAVWIGTGTTIFTTSVIEPELPTAGQVVFSGTVDAATVIAPRWVSTTFVPASTGAHTLSLDWDGSADVRFDVRDVTTGAWLGAATDGPAPRSVTVDVDAGEPIRIAVWSTDGVADFEVVVDESPTPPDAPFFAGSVDADRVVAPKWVSTTFTAERSGTHTFSFGDDSDPDLRMEFREVASGAWLVAGRPTVWVDLEQGVEYRLAVWVVDGTAEFAIALGG